MYIKIFCANTKRTIQFNVALGANMGRACKVYLLFLYKEDLIEMVKNMNLEQFFRTKRSFIMENAASLSCIKRVLVPGKSYAVEEVAIDPNRLLLSIVVLSELSEKKYVVNKKLLIPGNVERIKITIDVNGLEYH